MENNLSSWGYHLMLDCGGCQNIDNKENIYNFIKDLVPSINMIAHGEPIIEYLLQGDPKQGFSLMQLITTSNICGHFMELDGTAYFDIFSCKEFDLKLAEDIVRKYFKPSSVKLNFITRQA
jgi:S-adenosylmethionine/arginine decarboxylase-like enzyme